MTIDRTEANRKAVLGFLTSELGGKIRPHDTGKSQGIFFRPERSRLGRLQIGENVLADYEPEDLIRRLKADRVINFLKTGQSVSVVTDGTAVVP